MPPHPIPIIPSIPCNATATAVAATVARCYCSLLLLLAARCSLLLLAARCSLLAARRSRSRPRGILRLAN
jgi:hypothetical protein